MTQVITEPKLIDLYRLKVIESGLKLEMKGLHRHGTSCYSLAIRALQCAVTLQVEMPGRKSQERMQWVLDRLQKHISNLEVQAGVQR